MQATTIKTAAAKTVATRKASAKPAAKPATKTVAKAAPKAAAKAKTAPKAKAPAIKVIIADYARPAAGNRLAAFTQAWLDLSGLAAGSAVQRATIVKVAGPRAVQYHTGNGNIESTPDGLKLTQKGYAAFSSRSVDPELLKAYTEALSEGKQSDIVAKDAEAYVKI